MMDGEMDEWNGWMSRLVGYNGSMNDNGEMDDRMHIN